MNAERMEPSGGGLELNRMHWLNREIVGIGLNKLGHVKVSTCNLMYVGYVHGLHKNRNGGGMHMSHLSLQLLVLF